MSVNRVRAPSRREAGTLLLLFLLFSGAEEAWSRDSRRQAAKVRASPNSNSGQGGGVKKSVSYPKREFGPSYGRRVLRDGVPGPMMPMSLYNEVPGVSADPELLVPYPMERGMATIDEYSFRPRRGVEMYPVDQMQMEDPYGAAPYGLVPRAPAYATGYGQMGYADDPFLYAPQVNDRSFYGIWPGDRSNFGAPASQAASFGNYFSGAPLSPAVQRVPYPPQYSELIPLSRGLEPNSEYVPNSASVLRDVGQNYGDAAGVKRARNHHHAAAKPEQQSAGPGADSRMYVRRASYGPYGYMDDDFDESLLQELEQEQEPEVNEGPQAVNGNADQAARNEGTNSPISISIMQAPEEKTEAPAKKGGNNEIANKDATALEEEIVMGNVRPEMGVQSPAENEAPGADARNRASRLAVDRDAGIGNSAPHTRTLDGSNKPVAGSRRALESRVAGSQISAPPKTQRQLELADQTRKRFQAARKQPGRRGGQGQIQLPGGHANFKRQQILPRAQFGDAREKQMKGQAGGRSAIPDGKIVQRGKSRMDLRGGKMTNAAQQMAFRGKQLQQRSKQFNTRAGEMRKRVSEQRGARDGQRAGSAARPPAEIRPVMNGPTTSQFADATDPLALVDNGLGQMFGVNDMNRRRRSALAHDYSNEEEGEVYPIIAPVAVPIPAGRKPLYSYGFPSLAFNRNRRRNEGPVQLLLNQRRQVPTRRVVKRIIRKLPPRRRKKAGKVEQSPTTEATTWTTPTETPTTTTATEDAEDSDEDEDEQNDVSTASPTLAVNVDESTWSWTTEEAEESSSLATSSAAPHSTESTDGSTTEETSTTATSTEGTKPPSSKKEKRKEKRNNSS